MEESFRIVPSDQVFFIYLLHIFFYEIHIQRGSIGKDIPQDDTNTVRNAKVCMGNGVEPDLANGINKLPHTLCRGRPHLVKFLKRKRMKFLNEHEKQQTCVYNTHLQKLNREGRFHRCHGRSS